MFELSPGINISISSNCGHSTVVLSTIDTHNHVATMLFQYCPAKQSDLKHVLISLDDLFKGGNNNDSGTSVLCPQLTRQQT